ncbi:MAG: hypothetical protein DKT66_26335 [Candidatus Melainabacteria bacterium]|nr:MAG: hypothetical protein DKT66_26335 [Candidatus Melainabacteria bacterium]
MTEEMSMRLLLWGLAAVALFATEPGKRLQQKAVSKFKKLRGGGDEEKAESNGEQENVEVGANGKPSKKEEESGKRSESGNGKRKLRAVSKDESEKDESEKKESRNRESDNDQAELESSRVAMKESAERRPEMGAADNEDEEEPRIFEESSENEEASDEESSDDSVDEETTSESEDESDDDSKDEKAGDEKASDEETGKGLDQKKAEELVEKLNTKPSAPEGELKSA